MKTYSLSIFILIFILNFNFGKAQSLNEFGLKAGINFVDIRNKLSDDGVTHVNKNGFYLGAFMEFRRSVNFSIQPEIYYSSNKNRKDENIGLLHIPILLKYKLGNRFELYGGPESQFLLSVYGIDINKDKSYKKFILSAIAGVGFIISNEFAIDARYNLAVSNYIDSGNHQNTKLNFIQIGLTYKFDN
ncbi:porin family protein [Lutibacter sp. A64]|uniref:porin family protein n=1 Tax=Lutibacter sp. A64 TaxID=2918526 RepID=UPI001F05FBC7|nr:porin family protein [Lutibacter sp. A64]UMB54749.1 porin family protein [Lutibacter sp. A64]